MGHCQCNNATQAHKWGGTVAKLTELKGPETIAVKAILGRVGSRLAFAIKCPYGGVAFSHGQTDALGYTPSKLSVEEFHVYQCFETSGIDPCQQDRRKPRNH